MKGPDCYVYETGYKPTDFISVCMTGLVPTAIVIDWGVIRSQASTADNYPLKVRAIPFRSCAEFFNICIHVQGKCAL